MLFNFFKYLYDIDNDGIGNYLNCYSTYLMTKKDLCDNILNHRMNVLINYYISNTLPPPRKYDLYNYYLSNWTDNYLSKPRIVYNDSYKKNSNDKWNDMEEDEDVRDHYYFMTLLPIPKKEIDYDEYDKRFYEEEEEKRLEELNKRYDTQEYYDDDLEYDDWDYEVDYDIDYENVYDYYEYK